MSSPVVHWEIGGHDTARLREFYGRAFGWTMRDAGPDYTIVETGDGGLPGGIMRTPQDAPAYATVYAQVADLEAKLAEITELGGKVIVPPTAIDRGMSFALFADPEGTMIGLLRRHEPHA